MSQFRFRKVSNSIHREIEQIPRSFCVGGWIDNCLEIRSTPARIDEKGILEEGRRRGGKKGTAFAFVRSVRHNDGNLPVRVEHRCHETSTSTLNRRKRENYTQVNEEGKGAKKKQEKFYSSD